MLYNITLDNGFISCCIEIVINKSFQGYEMC